LTDVPADAFFFRRDPKLFESRGNFLGKLPPCRLDNGSGGGSDAEAPLPIKFSRGPKVSWLADSRLGFFGSERVFKNVAERRT
jgi:hypothetical protein